MGQINHKPDSVIVVIYLGLTLPSASRGTIAKTSEQLPLRDALAALQQTGFTFFPGHPG
jgi:hypothetical protein